MRKISLPIIALTLIILSSCAPTRFVEPLPKGEQAVSGTFGGPMVHLFGAVIPMPFTSLTYGYGLDSNSTIFGSIHTTSLAFANIQNEFGWNHKLLPQNGYRPAVSFNVVANTLFATRDNAFKLWPEIDLNAYWKIRQKNLFYVGVSNWFELSSLKAHQEAQTNHWLPNLQMGYRHSTDKRWTYFIECKALGITNNNEDIVVDYLKYGSTNGALGFFLGISKTF
jgi:hypothetical protein